MDAGFTDETDVCEDNSVFTVSEELVPSHIATQSAEVRLDFHCSHNLRLQTNVGECGGQVWPGGMVLAEYLMKRQMDNLKGKTMFVCHNAFLRPSVVWSRQLQARAKTKTLLDLNLAVEAVLWGTSKFDRGVRLALLKSLVYAALLLHLQCKGFKALIHSRPLTTPRVFT